MRHAPWKERVSFGRGVIHVGVKRIARELSKVFDIRQRNLARRSVDRLADR